MLTSSGEDGVPAAIGACGGVAEGLCGMAEPTEAMTLRGVVGSGGKRRTGATNAAMALGLWWRW